MKRLVANLFYWFLDYVYITREQLRAVFGRDNPEQYRTEGGTPIVVIPGVYENWRFIRPIAQVLHSHGYDVHIISRLGYNRGTVEQMAEVVKEYVIEHKLRNVTLVAHSKGGLIGKYLLADEQHSGLFNKLIAINTPFSGSRYAYILPIRSLRIFAPHSKILSSLAHDHLNNSRIVSIYGRFDPHIPGGSKLEGAKNIQLNTYGHFRIIKDQTVHATILENISTSNNFV